MKFLIGVVGLIIFAGSVFGSTCWVSEQPMAQSIDMIGTSELVNWQKTTYWLNYSGVASTSLKFSVKFDSNSPQRVHMQKFENTPASFSTPFSIVSDSGDLIHGPAVLTVKDDFGKCKFNFRVVRVHKMEIGGAYKIPDLVSNMCIGSTFSTTINTVSRARVYLYIQHTAVGDLEITLQAPNNGPVVTLSDNNSGLGDNFGAGLGFVNPGYGWTLTVFDDDASTHHIRYTAIFRLVSTSKSIDRVGKSQRESSEWYVEYLHKRHSSSR